MGTSPEIGLLCAVVISSVLSVLSSAWLFYTSYGLNRALARRLFPRQIWHLAVADMLMSISSMANAVLEFGGVFSVPLPVGDLICLGVVTMYSSCIAISAFCELHIALGFACVHFRWLKALISLSWLLVFVWPIGIIIGVVNTLEFVDYSTQYQECTLRIKGRVLAVTTLVTFTISLIAYSATVVSTQCQAWRSPSSVRSQMWHRALLYPVDFLITYGLLVVYLWSPEVVQRNRTLFAAALTLESSNGWVNLLTYWFNTRYAKRQFPLISSEPNAPTATPEEVVSGFASFHVAFASCCEERQFSVNGTPASSRTGSEF